ncbi:hypothetical protein JHK82_013713 [Glycine max]|nr:hypothetical protein JHK82_013713 [Glycine max]
MGRAPCCDKANVKRGRWSPEEDETLKNYLKKHATPGNWITLPQKAANTNATGNTVFSTPTSQPQVEDCSVFDDHENSAEYHVLGLEQTPLPLGSDVSGLGSSCSVPLSNEAVSASLVKEENENGTQWFGEDESFLLDFVYEDNGFVSLENSSEVAPSFGSLYAPNTTEKRKRDN